MDLSRTEFLRTTLRLSGAACIGAWGVTRSFAQDTAKKGKADKGPRLELDLVHEFVAKAHSDIDRVRSLLENQPALINAAWDWGDGDWETALGASAHMGRADIARHLLAHGARLDVFAAAMLGRLDVVKAAVTAFPDTPKVPGPHGIPLIAHARRGGKDASAVVEFLETLDS